MSEWDRELYSSCYEHARNQESSSAVNDDMMSSSSSVAPRRSGKRDLEHRESPSAEQLFSSTSGNLHLL